MFIVDDCVKEEKREKKLCAKTDANESMSFSKNKEIDRNWGKTTP